MRRTESQQAQMSGSQIDVGHETACHSANAPILLVASKYLVRHTPQPFLEVTVELVAWAAVPVVVVMVAAVGLVEGPAYWSGCHRPLSCPGLAPVRGQSMATDSTCHFGNRRRDTLLV
eukprot:COSAG02_NODE_23891_length_705_cov_0.765677_2_plen_117_part_01